MTAACMCSATLASVEAQKATCSLSHQGGSREFSQLIKHLSELPLTSKEEKQYLVMSKMKEDGSTEEKPYTYSYVT